MLWETTLIDQIFLLLFKFLYLYSLPFFYLVIHFTRDIAGLVNSQ